MNKDLSANTTLPHYSVIFEDRRGRGMGELFTPEDERLRPND